MMRLESPGLTVALAIAFGVMSLVTAERLRIPGIVILLAAGVILGPDVANVVRPQTLGHALPVLVSFAVAVILFESGLGLDLRRLRRETQSIRRLLLIGGAVTGVAAGLLARWVMRFGWRESLLFGALLIVTGPTVVNPLMRRLRIIAPVAAVLEAEGVFLDAIGAVLAAVAIEVVVSPSGTNVALGALGLVLRLGAGGLFGVIGGRVMVALLRDRGVVPDGLHSIVALGLTLGLAQVANTILPDSSVPTVIVAGAIVGNAHLAQRHELAEFKEQLTWLLLGMLFILLAADVRLADVRHLGWRALAVVAGLMLLVRPAAVGAALAGTSVPTKHRLFFAWISPRGVVAAAVASFFAERLTQAGFASGRDLRSLVFVVIACTVVFAGLTGGFAARLFGVRRPSDNGWVLLGGSSLSLLVGKLLRSAGEDVVIIDSNPLACRAAEERGIRAVLGNALSPRVLSRAELDTRAGAAALSPNDELNAMFVRHVKRFARGVPVFAIVSTENGATGKELMRELGASVAFGAPITVQQWAARIDRGDLVVDWRRAGPPPIGPTQNVSAQGGDPIVLPLLARRGDILQLVSENTPLADADAVLFAFDGAHEEAARAQLDGDGWVPLPSIAAHQTVTAPDLALA